MTKVTCEIIQDLLPLYIDGVASEDSQELIQKHLDSCSSCREYYHRLTDTGSTEIRSKNLDDQAVIKGIRKKLHWKRIRTVCLSFGLAAAAALGIFYGVFVKEAYMPYEDAGIIVEDNILKATRNYYCSYGFDTPDSGTEFIYLTTTVYHNYLRSGEQIELRHLDEAGPTSQTLDEDENVIDEATIREIYYIPKDYAEKMKKPGFWDGDPDKAEEQLEELKEASVLIWSEE